MGLASEMEIKNIYLALDEVLNNAIMDGSLEVDSSLRDEEGGNRKFEEVIAQRENEPKYADRRIEIQADYTEKRAVFKITDPGRGFDYNALPDPTSPENLLREHGRGLLLVQCFMDEIKFNKPGNEVTLVKNRQI